MSCHKEPDPLRDAGAIAPAIVAGLAGLDPEQLERWRADGLLPASVINDDPDREEFGDPPWYYSWNDHHRVLAAAKLLELGLPEADLPDALARLDAACPQWAVELPIRLLEDALPQEVDPHRFWAERWHEGPLGKLYTFGDSIEMVPGRCDAEPTIRQRRIDTAMLAREHRTQSVDTLAHTYWLPRYAVRRAIEFERALRSFEQIHAPAAG